jgi:hypothetical protein
MLRHRDFHTMEKKPAPLEMQPVIVFFREKILAL